MSQEPQSHIPDLIVNNPFRQIGVVVNTSKRDILSALNRLRAFIKIGKPAVTDYDLDKVLPPLSRTEQSLTLAINSIELPMDRLRHMMFWFPSVTDFDRIALHHLAAGNITRASEIWSKKQDLSSLLNLSVCSWISSKYETALKCVDKLLTEYGSELCDYADSTLKLTSAQLIDIYLDAVSEDPDALMNLYQASLNTPPSAEISEVLSKRITEPLCDALNQQINATANIPKDDPQANLKHAKRLSEMKCSHLWPLGKIIGSEATIYETLADKLGMAINRAVVTYGNYCMEHDDEIDEDLETEKQLLQYALVIVVSQSCKEQIRKNIEIVTEQIKSFVPLAARAQLKRMKVLIEDYAHQPSTAQGAKAFLEKCQAPLKVLKSCLTGNTDLYLKISTRIANDALNDIIHDYNQRNAGSQGFKECLNTSYVALLIIKNMDLESDFRSTRFTPNYVVIEGTYKIFKEAISPVYVSGNDNEKSWVSTFTENQWGIIIWLVLTAIFGIITMCNDACDKNSVNYNSESPYSTVSDSVGVEETVDTVAPEVTESSYHSEDVDYGTPSTTTTNYQHYNTVRPTRTVYSTGSVDFDDLEDDDWENYEDDW